MTDERKEMVTLADELLPCPFCGSGGHLADTGNKWIACNSCTSEGPAGYTEQEAIKRWNTRTSASAPAVMGRDQPRVTDDDAGGITVTLSGNELRGWSYSSDDEQRIKMLAAREYVEGWCDGRDQ